MAVPATVTTGVVRLRGSPFARTTSRRNMGSYNNNDSFLQEKLPAKSVIDAAQQLEGNKIVASDIAAAAGVSLSQARKDLTALASITQGDIAVDQDGELVYTFPSNIQSVLANKSLKYKTIQVIRKIWPAVFWGVRVSFGLALVASIVAIFSTIFFIQASSSSDDNDDRRRDNRSGGGGFGGSSLNMYFGPSPFDFFYYRPYGAYGYYNTGRDPEEMSFLESVFSYVFGDGNPNAGLEEKRLALAANMIRQNGGAVTAEQLAPFCDEAPTPRQMEESNYADESFVLPIVTALDGLPQVTPNGEIVYIFPELQQSATNKQLRSKASRESMILRRAGIDENASASEIQQFLRYNRINTRGALEKSDLIARLEQALPPMSSAEEAELLDSDPDVLQEREYRFSLAPETNRFFAGALGIVNVIGALYLGNQLNQLALYGVQLPSYFGMIQSIYPGLLAYAVLFNVIPILRRVWISQQNEKIRQRNKVRRDWKTTLAAAIDNGKLGKKLKSCKSMRRDVKKLGTDDRIVYDTKNSMEELKSLKDADRLKEFDKKLLDSGEDEAAPFQ